MKIETRLNGHLLQMLVTINIKFPPNSYILDHGVVSAWLSAFSSILLYYGGFAFVYGRMSVI